MHAEGGEGCQRWCSGERSKIRRAITCLPSQEAFQDIHQPNAVANSLLPHTHSLASKVKKDERAAPQTVPSRSHKALPQTTRGASDRVKPRNPSPPHHQNASACRGVVRRTGLEQSVCPKYNKERRNLRTTLRLLGVLPEVHRWGDRHIVHVEMRTTTATRC